jgi:hypothetical protein
MTIDTRKGEDPATNFWYVPMCEDAQCSSVVMVPIHEDPPGSEQAVWGKPVTDVFRNLPVWTGSD